MAQASGEASSISWKEELTRSAGGRGGWNICRGGGGRACAPGLA